MALPNLGVSESGNPGEAARNLPLGSRFRGNDEERAPQ
jgi:hypothetical protein